jgi:hypothetical protein
LAEATLVTPTTVTIRAQLAKNERNAS